MINLELSAGLENIENMVGGLAKQMMRPIARKYDKLEHQEPKELAMFGQMMGGGALGGGRRAAATAACRHCDGTLVTRPPDVLIRFEDDIQDSAAQVGPGGTAEALAVDGEVVVLAGDSALDVEILARDRDYLIVVSPHRVGLVGIVWVSVGIVGRFEGVSARI